MKDLNKYDVTVKVCDFKTPSKSAHKVIDGSFFRSNVLRNPKWQQKLADGLVLGLFTHKGRQPDLQRKEIPYEDNIAVSPYLCNVARDVWVEDDCLFAGLDLFEKREYGALLKDMLSKKLNVPVSMAVRAASDFNNFYVKDLLGVDFTFRPDLEAEIVHMNFSETESDPEDVFCYFSYEPSDGDIIFNPGIIEPKSKVYDMGFSSENYEIFIPPEKYKQLEELDFKFSRDETLVNGMMPITIRNMSNLTKAQQEFLSEFDSVSNFSTNATAEEIDTTEDLEGITIFSNEELDKMFSDPEIDFSLQQYLQELKLAPFQVLKKRVTEVIRWVISNNQEKVAKASPTLKSYLDTYILKWVHDVLNNPTEKFNLMLGLRLANYKIDRRDLVELQRCFNRSKQMIMQNGVMQQSIQTALNHSYRKVLSGLYDYINEQCARSGHHLV